MKKETTYAEYYIDTLQEAIDRLEQLQKDVPKGHRQHRFFQTHIADAINVIGRRKDRAEAVLKNL